MNVNYIKHKNKIEKMKNTLKNVKKELKPEMPFQNAFVYEKELFYDVDFWYASYKRDGVRCRYTNINFQPVSKRFKIIENAQIFTPIIERLLYEFELKIIDGEIYNHNLTFNELNGILNQKNPKLEDIKKLQYHIFACVSDRFENTDDMTNELEKIRNWLNEYEIENIKVVEYFKIKNDYNEIMKALDKANKIKYEGIILRSPCEYYKNDRLDILLKVKTQNSADLKIVDILKGNKSFNDRCGSLICEGYVDDVKTKRRYKVKVKVGSGIDYDLRYELLKNKDKYIGKTVEIFYSQISKNKNNEYSLRFPVFFRLRYDK